MLSTGQLDTLRNLAAKKAGDDVGWVTIATARDLTERGLATRTRSGWQITPTGEAALERAAAARPRRPAAPLPFLPRAQPAAT